MSWCVEREYVMRKKTGRQACSYARVCNEGGHTPEDRSQLPMPPHSTTSLMWATLMAVG